MYKNNTSYTIIFAFYFS